MRVHRVDVGQRIRADQKTVQGNARIPAALSRTGVQVYPQEDGTVRREYRPPEEVFAPDSMKSFETATVVVGHPATIDPSNWRQHAIGDIRAPKRDGRFVAAELVIRDRAALDRIDSGELQELSCGYDCMLEMTPGTTADGERYDAVQRQIVINHVGLGPKAWGRAGSEVRLRLDGGVVAYEDGETARHRPADMDPEQLKALLAKVDGLAKDLEAERKRAGALEAKLQAAATTQPPARRDDEANVDRVTAQRDEALAKLEKLEKATSMANVDALVAARMAVLDGARLLHGKPEIPLKNADGRQLTDREIMVAAIVARDAEFKADGRSDDYVRARFDAKVEDAKKAGASLGALNLGTSPAHLDAGGHADAGGDAELAEAMRHFDAAPLILENYNLSDPWLYGEGAAMEAAIKAAGKAA